MLSTLRPQGFRLTAIKFYRLGELQNRLRSLPSADDVGSEQAFGSFEHDLPSTGTSVCLEHEQTPGTRYRALADALDL